ncbi:hypothetical protein BH09PLA1_BH09PLA1_05160 [soil metagenome]
MAGKKQKRQGGRATSRSPRRAQASTTGSKPVGSDANAAKSFGGKGDFGVPETGHERERQYVSQETKSQDPGGIPAHAGSNASRVTGVGGNESGIGSSSGGDVDTDIVGVGAGGATVSQSGPDIGRRARTDGADMVRADRADGDQPDQAARDKRGRGAKQPNSSTGKHSGANNPGAFVDRTGGDITSTGGGEGSAAATNPLISEGDAFAGEVSLDDASGADNSRSDRV